MPAAMRSSLRHRNCWTSLTPGRISWSAFDEELFCELVDKIIVESNERLWFRLKNGLELRESIERTVR